MKQYSLRELYAGLGQAIQELPFAITKRNKIVAIAVAPDAVTVPNAAEAELSTEKKVENIVKGYQREHPGENKPTQSSQTPTLSEKKLEKTTEKVAMPSTWLNKYKK